MTLVCSSLHFIAAVDVLYNCLRLPLPCYVDPNGFPYLLITHAITGHKISYCWVNKHGTKDSVT